MSGVFDSVMTQLAAGSSPRSAARTLGISLDLAEAVADEAARMGLVVSGGTACGTCAPASSPACAGCPFTDGKASGAAAAGGVARASGAGGETGAARASGAKPRGGPTPVALTLRPYSR